MKRVIQSGLCEQIILVQPFRERHELEQVNYVFGSAMKNDHLPTIRWFVETYNWLILDHRGKWIDTVMEKAAESANLEVLKYLYDHRLSKCELQILGEGVASGQIAIVKWLHAKGIGGGDTNLLLVAAEKRTWQWCSGSTRTVLLKLVRLI